MWKVNEQGGPNCRDSSSKDISNANVFLYLVITTFTLFNGLHKHLKNSHFCRKESITLKTFGEIFLSLENSFEFLVILFIL